jgi:hypothetical protein
VLFVPSRKQRRPIDPVEVIAQSLPSTCGLYSTCVEIPEKPPYLSSVLPQRRRKLARRVVLFAHPSNTFEGFEVNKAKTAGYDVLPPPWWHNSSMPSEILVAHVCYGERVLTKNDWSKIFPRWISYRNRIDALMHDPGDKAIWAQIALDVINATIESPNVLSLSHQLKAVYESKMAELSADIQGSNVLHLMHFQNALENLVSSGE